MLSVQFKMGQVIHQFNSVDGDTIIYNIIGRSLNSETPYLFILKVKNLVTLTKKQSQIKGHYTLLDPYIIN
jgi:hypothetical protein